MSAPEADTPSAPTLGPGDRFDLGPLSVVLEIAAGIEHERQTYRRCVERESDLRDEIDRTADRRLEAFGNLAVFGRSPFVAEWVHHVPTPDAATCEAFARLVGAP